MDFSLLISNDPIFVKFQVMKIGSFQTSRDWSISTIDNRMTVHFTHKAARSRPTRVWSVCLRCTFRMLSSLFIHSDICWGDLELVQMNFNWALIRWFYFACLKYSPSMESLDVEMINLTWWHEVESNIFTSWKNRIKIFPLKFNDDKSWILKLL